jgi:cold shock CspA family protein
METQERTATVLNYDRLRGWGFALPDASDENDIFIHRSCLPDARKFLNTGDRIIYTLGEYNGRPVAQNIRLAPAQAPVDGVK